MNQARVIKRYANRKMYDTARSCYVTLEEVADMVREGCEVQVIDNKTKQDLTEVTLTQALLDSERKRRGTVPLSGLRSLIASGEDFLHKRVAEPVIRVRSEAERTVVAWRDEAGRTVSQWKTEAERRAERVLHRRADGEPEPNEVGGDPAQGPTLAVLVEQTQKAVDEFQHRVDERIRHALATLGLPGTAHQHDQQLQGEVEALRARVVELEARLQRLEQAAPPESPQD